MKLGIILYSTDAEVVFNAFRLANYAFNRKDTVKIFLLAQGVEYETLDNDKFKIIEQARLFLDSGGQILACGTCLKIRGFEATETCPISTMADLYQIIKESDKVLTF